MQLPEANQPLSQPEKWLAFKAFFILQTFNLAIRLRGFRPLYQRLLRASRARALSAAGLTPQQVKRLGGVVGVANHRIRLLHVACLPESLTTWWLLRRRGVDAQMWLGVRKVDQSLTGHAWVEYQGRVISGDPELTVNTTRFMLPSDGA